MINLRQIHDSGLWTYSFSSSPYGPFNLPVIVPTAGEVTFVPSGSASSLAASIRKSLGSLR